MCLAAVFRAAENWPACAARTITAFPTKRICRAASTSRRTSSGSSPSGPGGATPIVWEDHIFLTAPKGSNLDLLCVSTSGKELWRRTVGHGNRNVRGDEGNSCSPSPVTDGKHVWTLMGSGDLACFDFDGKEIWKIKLQDRYHTLVDRRGRIRLMFGLTSTPVRRRRSALSAAHSRRRQSGDARSHRRLSRQNDRKGNLEVARG